MLCLSFKYFLFCEGSPESVLQTIKELEENIQEGISVAKKKERKTLSHAKVVGTACDVCKPEDVKKLVNFAIDELGSVDIWVGSPLLISSLNVYLISVIWPILYPLN